MTSEHGAVWSADDARTAEPSAEATPYEGPLTGLKVLDLTRILAGPWATQILADFGADVVKVEEPRTGDDTRGFGPPFLATPADPERPYSPLFIAANRNKRSLALDIASPEGGDIVRRLAARADVVVENFKVGGLKRYGLDYESLAAVNPRLIYCSVTGFGQSGPYAPRGGYDFLVQGMGGLMSVTGEADEDGGEPMKVGVPLTDIITGLYATIAIQLALTHRARTGEGQHVDCALLDSVVACLLHQSHGTMMGGPAPRRMGNQHPFSVPYRTFACADGHVIVATANTRQFQAICRMIGREDLADDARLHTALGRMDARTTIDGAIAEAFGRLTKGEAIAAMVQHGVPGGPINTVPEVLADPQVVSRQMTSEVHDDAGAAIPTVRFPSLLSATAPRPASAPPRLGQHSRSVLAELGLAADEIERLVCAGIVHAAR